jgi:ATP-dependent Clp protease adaptor protein ClpS
MSENEHNQNEKGVTTLARPKLKHPDMYKVLLLNDDYTTMEFVVHVLQKFFHKTQEEATRIMLAVHQHGKGIAGLYPYDVAATKIVEVGEYARKFEMPLKCTMEAS